jgi:hypothetical protein
MNQSIKRETASLLLEFNKVDTKKKSLFWEKWDEEILDIEQKMSAENSNWIKEYKKIIQYWRENNSIPIDLYWFLRRNFPVPIPYVLFFPSKKIINYNVGYNKYICDLADKWLMDILSRESFYKRNKDFFSRAEVKYFLTCNWDTSLGNCYDLIDYFFNIKIEANNLNLSSDIFNCFSDCFADHIVIEYFKFLCNNKKYINNEEIKETNKFLKSEYISVGKKIDFKNHTYHSFKRLYDEWYISNMIKNRFEDCCDHKIVQNYIFFICKNVKRVRDKEEEIRDILDFLRTEYINNGQDFSFENITWTWRELKRLSDEWYVSNMFRDRIVNFDHKIVQDYIIFICKKVKRVKDREEEIRDILDFLNNRINNEQEFSFENMTWRELKRLSDEWHFENRWARDPYSRNYLNAKWKKSSIKDFVYEKDKKTWTIKEITTGKSLCEEGEDMDHCVFSYAENCIQGYCLIFSVSYKSGENGSKKRIATVEISRDMELVQARGPCNASIDNETADIIKIWADENKIDCGNNLVGRRQVYGDVVDDDIY